MSSPAVVIIADDLTGALDSSAPFATMGLRCVTALSAATLPAALAQSPQVLAVTLGTREASPQVAGQRATDAVLSLRPFAGPGTLWLKKIDSRMKGPVAAETAAIARALGLTRVLLCPAIPDLGRIVRQGHVTGAGVTEPIPVRLALDGVTISTPDAETVADLDRILQDAGPDCLLVGARGLAGAVARALPSGRPPAPARLPPGALGFALGSRDPVTLAQIAALRDGGGPRWVAAPDGQVPPPSAPGAMLVQATPGPGAEASAVATALAQGVLPYLSGLGALVIGGGETVAALLQAAGAGLVQVQGEVLPGLPLCRVLDLPCFPVLITKSGGFGQADTLLQLWQTALSALDTHPCP